MRGLSDLREGLRGSLWFFPALGLVLALAAGLLAVEIDRARSWPALRGIVEVDADAARELLGTIASSILTLAALIFSVTMIVLQLAASQFSPRVTRSFVRDNLPQLTMAVLLGTFTYVVVVLRAVHREASFVPAVSVAGVYLLTFASLAMFVAYLDHVGRSMRVSYIIERVAKEAAGVIHGLDHRGGTPAPLELLRAPAARTITWAGHGGVVTHVAEAELIRRARRAGVVLRVVPAVGDFVPWGGALIEVLGAPDELDERALRRCVSLGVDRTPQQDLALGLRHLVDIALRALSTGVNDPTTAVQAIDRLHELLRRLAARPLEPRWALREGREVRVVLGQPSWANLVALAVTEIRLSAGCSIQVFRRLLFLLDDLLATTSGQRATVVADERRLLLDTIDARFVRDEDRERATSADAQGLGTRVAGGPPTPDARH